MFFPVPEGEIAKLARYFLIGAFIPFSKDQAVHAWLQEQTAKHLYNSEAVDDNEENDNHFGLDEPKTVYFVEILSENKVTEVLPAM